MVLDSWCVWLCFPWLPAWAQAHPHQAIVIEACTLARLLLGGLKRCMQYCSCAFAHLCLRACWPVCFHKEVCQSMKTSHHKRQYHFPFLLHAASSHIALIAMATGALSLGSACIQSEWDLCRDSSGLHLFNLPHRNSLHTEKAGTKSRVTPSPQPGMTSKNGATGLGYRECGSNT